MQSQIFFYPEPLTNIIIPKRSNLVMVTGKNMLYGIDLLKQNAVLTHNLDSRVNRITEIAVADSGIAAISWKGEYDSNQYNGGIEIFDIKRKNVIGQFIYDHHEVSSVAYNEVSDAFVATLWRSYKDNECNNELHCCYASDGMLFSKNDLSSNEINFLISSIPLSSNVIIASESSKGKTTSGHLMLWSISDRKPLKYFKTSLKSIRCVRCSYDGRMIAACGGEAGKYGQFEIWDVSSGKELYKIGGKNTDGFDDCVTIVAFTPDNKTIAAVHKPFDSDRTDYRVSLWDVNSGEQCGEIYLPYSGNGPLRVIDIAFLRYESTLVCSCWHIRGSGEIRLIRL